MRVNESCRHFNSAVTDALDVAIGRLDGQGHPITVVLCVSCQHPFHIGPCPACELGHEVALLKQEILQHTNPRPHGWSG